MKVFLGILAILAYFQFSDCKTSRIIGGYESTPGQFPFMAAIYATTADGRFFCSGTLLSNTYILTAAQCIAGAHSLEIHLGSVHLTKPDPSRMVLTTSTYIIHPDYKPNSFENDIGIIQLRIPITFNEYISSIHSIPVSNFPGGFTMLALGWGQTSDTDGELSETLRFARLSTISNEECKINYGNQITDQMICAVGNFNEGTCIGDIGGPLILNVKFAHYQVHGISSFISGSGCESTDPSGYTRVFVYDQWIYNVTGLTPV